MAWGWASSRRRTRGKVGIGGALAGLAAGAGLVYFLDPVRGADRRSRALARTRRAARDAERTAQSRARDLGHRARGAAHEARARAGRERVPDEILLERVRARLGHLVAHPRAVEVVVRDGEVELAGPVFRAEHARALRGVRAVRGVRGVHDRLRAHDAAEGVAELQGRGPLAPARGGALPGGATTVAVALGSVAAARALLGRRLLGIPAVVAGAALARGAARGSSSRSRHLARLAAREVSRDAEHVREREADREAHSGAWHPEPEDRPAPRASTRRRAPEVREVKSPAELEAGIAHGSPEPTFPDRVSRREGDRARGAGARGRGARGGRARAGGEPGSSAREDPSLLEPMPRAGFDAPPPGAGVHEHDLGAVPGPDELEPGEGEPDGGSERG